MEYAPLISTEDDVGNKTHINYHKADAGQGFDAHTHDEEGHHHTVTCTVGSLKVVADGIETLLTPESGAYTFPQGSLHSVEVTADGTEFFTVHPWGEGYEPATAQESQQEITQDTPQE